MYYTSSFLLIPKGSRVLPFSVRYGSLAFRTRRACPANRITYGLEPQQIVKETIYLVTTLSLSVQSVLQYRRWQGCSEGVPMKL